MAPLLLWSYSSFRPSPATIILIFGSGCILLSLYLLPRLKGMIVAVQWAKRMHGFGGPNHG
ncbi:MAG: DUF983 domain-containing protein, partial [Paracoccaceae bacterium]